MSKDMRNLVQKGYDEGKYDEVYKRKNTILNSFEKFIIEEFNLLIVKKLEVMELYLY